MAYTTADKVRKLLPDLLETEDDLGAVTSGTSLILSNYVFAVPTILKNSTELIDTTDYTFNQPDRVTLLVAAAGERFVARVHIAYNDTDIETFITESDRIIDRYFMNITPAPVGYYDDWSKYITAAKILLVKAHGNEDMLQWSKEYMDMAIKGIEAYIDNIDSSFSDGSGGGGGVTRYDKEPVNDFKLDQRKVAGYD